MCLEFGIKGYVSSSKETHRLTQKGDSKSEAVGVMLQFQSQTLTILAYV